MLHKKALRGRPAPNAALPSQPSSIRRRFSGGLIRKLFPHERRQLQDHLLRLDPEARRMRFAHPVSDASIAQHAVSTWENGSVVYGYLEEGVVHALAELHKLGDRWGLEAEAAFSVESPYQDVGIGTELMSRVIRAARNRGVQRLLMTCLAENARMQVIARKNAAALRFRSGDVIGEIVPSEPGYLSYLGEAMEDGVSAMLAVFELGHGEHGRG